MGLLKDAIEFFTGYRHGPSDLIGLLTGRAQCDLCGKYYASNPILVEVYRANSYYEKKYRYHVGCLYDVLDHPEMHGHRKVDLAIDITDCVAMREEAERKRKIHQQERLDNARRMLRTLSFRTLEDDNEPS